MSREVLSSQFDKTGKPIYCEIFMPSGVCVLVWDCIQLRAGNCPGTDLFSPGFEAIVDMCFSNQKIPKGGVVFLDPRCVVVESGARHILYSPSWYMDRFEAPILEWMMENPEWPPTVKFQDGTSQSAKEI